MASHRATRVERRPRRSGRWWSSVQIRAVLSLGLVLGVGSAGTFAYWTDEATVTGLTITAGTLDLELQDDADDSVSFTSLNISTMIPGQSVAGVLKVENVGNVGFTYTAATSVSNSTLASALDVKVTNGAVSGSSPSATCSGTQLSGTGSTLSQALVSTGRSLAASASENLCIQVSMPSGASSSLQGLSTNVTYTFTATQ
jgi:predicted ribosomally synthesized peptide with SipW-like signal peptide